MESNQYAISSADDFSTRITFTEERPCFSRSARCPVLSSYRPRASKSASISFTVPLEKPISSASFAVSVSNSPFGQTTLSAIFNSRSLLIIASTISTL